MVSIQQKNEQGKDIFKIIIQGELNNRIVIKSYGPDLEKITE